MQEQNPLDTLTVNELVLLIGQKEVELTRLKRNEIVYSKEIQNLKVQLQEKNAMCESEICEPEVVAD